MKSLLAVFFTPIYTLLTTIINQIKTVIALQLLTVLFMFAIIIMLFI